MKRRSLSFLLASSLVVLAAVFCLASAGGWEGLHEERLQEPISTLSADDESGDVLALLRQTQVGSPVEGLHIARPDTYGSNQVQSRQSLRRQHRLGCQLSAIRTDNRQKQAAVCLHILLTHQFADGHYIYARQQLRC